MSALGLVSSTVGAGGLAGEGTLAASVGTAGESAAELQAAGDGGYSL